MYSLTKYGYEVVQFNLMKPHLTDVFNPLINAIQEFRRGNVVKGTALIDALLAVIFPKTDDIWDPAAANMFRRVVYLLFDYYIEKENYMRHLARQEGTNLELLEQEIDTLYSKITMFNIYSLIGELAAHVSSDANLININPGKPVTASKDFLTLLFDACEMLPVNTLRSKAIDANNAIKQIAPAPQTLAGVYANLLTGLSAYADDTVISLMSGSISESFDVPGLGFPRRFGVEFDFEFVKQFRVTNELCKWTFYRDKNYTDQYQGKEFYHEERVNPSNWVWGVFAGIFDQDEVYCRLDVTSNNEVVESFFFLFKKGYRTQNGIAYTIDHITQDRIVSNGTLIELDPVTKEPKISTFMTQSIDYHTQSLQPVLKPVFSRQQVFYTERPRAIFAITPPHLQHYQRHILIIIKQFIDEIYANAYVTKDNRKPIVGTRFLLEEFGNIRSGEDGIPDIDTVASIALGQDVQLTFVIQSYQQLRSLYNEAIEAVLKANSANTIFLKSNDKELIDDLVFQSGIKHEVRAKSKSVARKAGDIITTAEPTINSTMELTESSALTSNDLMFLAGASPGNSVAFVSNESPILNRMDTITPMAAGLHRRLPQEFTDSSGERTVPYSDGSMPVKRTADTINALDNKIDGVSLVLERVAQAKLAIDIKKRFMTIAEDNNIVINERDGELARLMMNTLYEEYDKTADNQRTSIRETISYPELTVKMRQLFESIRNNKLDNNEKLSAMTTLRDMLIRCTMDEKLDDITILYRDTKLDIPLVYHPGAVNKFIVEMEDRYPVVEVNTTKRNVFEDAYQDSRYKPYSMEDPEFTMVNLGHVTALEELIRGCVMGIKPPNGMRVDSTGNDTWDIHIGDKHIITFKVLGDDLEDIDYVATDKEIQQVVLSTPDVLDRIKSLIRYD